MSVSTISDTDLATILAYRNTPSKFLAIREARRTLNKTLVPGSNSCLVMDLRPDKRKMHLVVQQYEDQKILATGWKKPLPLNGIVELDKTYLPETSDIHSDEFATWLDKTIQYLSPINLAYIHIICNGTYDRHTIKDTEVTQGGEFFWKTEQKTFELSHLKIFTPATDTSWDSGAYHKARELVAMEPKPTTHKESTPRRVEEPKILPFVTRAAGDRIPTRVYEGAIVTIPLRRTD